MHFSNVFRSLLGHLFSVDPRVLRKIEGIFNFNERVLLSGHWEWGIFLYGAIGAFNVGSVKLNFKTEKVRFFIISICIMLYKKLNNIQYIHIQYIQIIVQG